MTTREASNSAGAGMIRARAEAEWASEDGVWISRRYAAGALHAQARPPIGRAALRDMAAAGESVTLV